jgi:transposase InsO family protein
LTYRYRFISEHHAAYGVARLCRILAVPRRQGYYEWLAGQPSRQRRAEADDRLVAEIRSIHGEHRGAYGSPRVAAELRRRGRRVNRKRVERIMRERGIVGQTRRRRRSLTRPDARAAPAPDLIGRDFTAQQLGQAPGQRFVGDITYLPTAEGWLYLATAIDLFNREVVGHAMAEHMRAELVCDAVELAHRRGLVAPGAVFHSDRGSQYSSAEFRTVLKALQIKASMGRVGSCYDNAVAESFFASLKAEIGTRVWATRAEARRAVFAYINYYNRHRLHSTLELRTPHEARVCYRPPIALAT